MRLTPAMANGLAVLAEGDHAARLVRSSDATTDMTLDADLTDRERQRPLRIYHGTARRLVLDGLADDLGDQLVMTEKGRGVLLLLVAAAADDIRQRGAA